MIESKDCIENKIFVLDVAVTVYLERVQIREWKDILLQCKD